MIVFYYVFLSEAVLPSVFYRENTNKIRTRTYFEKLVFCSYFQKYRLQNHSNIRTRQGLITFDIKMIQITMFYRDADDLSFVINIYLKKVIIQKCEFIFCLLPLLPFYSI